MERICSVPYVGGALVSLVVRVSVYISDGNEFRSQFVFFSSGTHLSPIWLIAMETWILSVPFEWVGRFYGL